MFKSAGESRSGDRREPDEWGEDLAAWSAAEDEASRDADDPERTADREPVAPDPVAPLDARRDRDPVAPLDSGRERARADSARADADPSRVTDKPPGVMIPARRDRLPFEAPLMRAVATAGVIGIGVAIAAIMSSQNSKGWLIGLVVSVVSVVLAAILWSSRRL